MKLIIVDRSGERDDLTGRSPENMIRRMFGHGARGPFFTAKDEPFTVVKSGGRVLGSAIIHDVTDR